MVLLSEGRLRVGLWEDGKLGEKRNKIESDIKHRSWVILGLRASRMSRVLQGFQKFESVEVGPSAATR